MNYLEDLKIDENNLNEMVIKQPILNMQYHQLYVDKMDELNEQKRKVQITKADLAEAHAKVFLQHKQSGVKMTEKEIESLIVLNLVYKKQQEKYFDEIKRLNEIDKSFNILDGVIKSFQQRKNAIEKAIELFIYVFHGEVRQKSVDDNSRKDILNKLNNKE